jgi:hypothetical protein
VRIVTTFPKVEPLLIFYISLAVTFRCPTVGPTIYRVVRQKKFNRVNVTSIGSFFPSCRVCLAYLVRTQLRHSVEDRHRFDADPDPDPNVHVDAVPDPDRNQNGYDPLADPTPGFTLFGKSESEFFYF